VTCFSIRFDPICPWSHWF